MTLDALNEHLHILWQYQAAAERLASLRAAALVAQQFDGMPHAPGVSNKVERLALVLAEQEGDVVKLEKELKKSDKVIRRYVDRIADNRTKLIFKLRFLCGMSWAEVAETIGGGNTEEAVKMSCYRFLMTEHGGGF